MLPHLVKDDDLGKAGARAKAAGEKLVGDPDKAFQEAEAVSEGQYGIPVVTHCCLETHGQVIQWQGDQVNVWPSTQDVTHFAGLLAPNLKVPIANIHVKQDHIGGGFGSKFAPDSWGEVGACLSQKAGGRPVRLFLDRATEQLDRGQPPFGVRQDQDRGQEGWHRHRVAIGIVGHGRFYRRRIAPPSVYHRHHSQPASAPHGRLGERRAEPRVAGAE